MRYAMSSDDTDYSAYLIEARITLDDVADLARKRQFWEASTKALALARLNSEMALVLSRCALSGNTPQRHDASG